MTEPTPGGLLERTMLLALEAQQQRRLGEAESLYRKALGLDPRNPDALHMLGVIRHERGDHSEAKELILQALELTGWRFLAFRYNLGLVLGKLHANARSDNSRRLEADYRAWAATAHQRHGNPLPSVAVVVPVFNHADYIESALESVYRQTYRNLELVVIDDGSTDRSPEVVRKALSRSPFPTQLRVRANQGAASTINEAIGLASSDYINILNSDDMFLESRIERMVEAVAQAEAGWGFAEVETIDASGEAIDLLCDPRAYWIACALGSLPLSRTIGYGLLEFNVAVSTGNLFFSRALWRKLGGFRDARYNHDWDFALRALWEEEPRFLNEPLYRYRLHRTNTISESGAAARQEAVGILASYLALATSAAEPPNPYAPSLKNWGSEFAVSLLAGGLAEGLDVSTMKRLLFQLDGESGKGLLARTGSDPAIPRG